MNQEKDELAIVEEEVRHINNKILLKFFQKK